jgi:hypothetical protein
MDLFRLHDHAYNRPEHERSASGFGDGRSTGYHNGGGAGDGIGFGTGGGYGDGFGTGNGSGGGCGEYEDEFVEYTPSHRLIFESVGRRIIFAGGV